MDRPRQDVLAGAALAHQQDARGGRRHLLDGPAQDQHAVVAGHQPGQRRRRRAARAPAVGLERMDMEGARDERREHAGIDRLRIEIVGAGGDGGHRVGAVLVMGIRAWW